MRLFTSIIVSFSVIYSMCTLVYKYIILMEYAYDAEYCKFMLLSPVQCPWCTQQHHPAPSLLQNCRCYWKTASWPNSTWQCQLIFLESLKLNKCVYTYVPPLNVNQCILSLMSICIYMQWSWYLPNKFDFDLIWDIFLLFPYHMHVYCNKLKFLKFIMWNLCLANLALLSLFASPMAEWSKA